MVLLITFEGIDGSGKSTQMTRLAPALEALGFSVLCTRDPGGTPLGQSLRNILLHTPDYVAPWCELLLYLADRAQHVETVLKPALAAGRLVLCDRYVDSTVAYQGGGRGLPIHDIHRLNQQVTQGLYPDLTFLLDAPTDVLLQRAKSRGESDRLEQETLTFYEHIRTAYHQLAQENPDRIQVMDARQDIETLQAQLLEAILVAIGRQAQGP